MRSYAMFGAIVVLAAAPLSAQTGFRTGDINPGRRLPTTVGGVLGEVRQQETRQTRTSDGVPRGHLPPAGMCRIWIDGVPPGRQPAPTDCQTAVATRPANARVIWGDQETFPGKANGKFSKKGLDKSGKIDRSDDDDDVRDAAKQQQRRGRGSVAKRGKKG